MEMHDLVLRAVNSIYTFVTNYYSSDQYIACEIWGAEGFLLMKSLKLCKSLAETFIDTNFFPVLILNVIYFGFRFEQYCVSFMLCDLVIICMF